MNIGTGSPAVTASIGFTTGNVDNNKLSVTNITTPAVSTTGTMVNNLVNSNVAGPIADLTSASDGNRVVYSFTPPIPNTPTNLSFIGVNAGGMTLNWIDNSSSELGFLIYRSDDNGTTYNLVGTTVLNTNSFNATGLNSNILYYWKVYAHSEGGFSSSLDGQQITNSASFPSGTKTIGATGNYTTLQSVFNDINAQGLTGGVVLELQPDYNPLGETYPIIVGKLTGSSESNAVNLRPAAGVTGINFNSNASQTFNLDQTDYLIIDGRPGGTGITNEIIISNTSTAGNSIKFINDASNNIIK
jgi:hypothetical protein